MLKVLYEVHSDEDENNVFESFDGKGSRQKALAYAKRHKADKAWVDKVLYDEDSGEYDYVDCIWCYDWEE